MSTKLIPPQPRNRRGQPTTYDPDGIERLVDDLIDQYGSNEQTLTIPQLAKALGVPHSTFYKWYGRHAEFRDAVKRLREHNGVTIEGRLYGHTKKNVLACMFALHNLLPEVYKKERAEESSGLRVNIQVNIGGQTLQVGAQALPGAQPEPVNVLYFEPVTPAIEVGDAESIEESTT